jgi:hypothetical protein
VSGNPTDHCALDTAFGLRCDAGRGESERQCEYSNETFHRDASLRSNHSDTFGCFKPFLVRAEMSARFFCAACVVVALS